VLGKDSSKYNYVDFCSGAGGPTIAIERELNARLAAAAITDGKDEALDNQKNKHNPPIQGKNTVKVDSTEISAELHQVHFILTDISPHVPAWNAACRISSRLCYVPMSIDASAAPPTLLSHVAPNPLPELIVQRQIFRLYSLAFHHFDDGLANKILANTLATSAGFTIFELQNRDFGSLITVLLTGPLLLLISPFYFWRDPVHLIFTYLLPIVPLVVVLDGIVSSLRTRTGEEIKTMIDQVIKERGENQSDWQFLWGKEWHTWPIGQMSWFTGVKKD
jgi:hypothetical protein